MPAAAFRDARKAFPNRETTEQAGAPFAMSREFFMSAAGRPCVRPPWGELVAVNADSGAIAWRSPLGDLREMMKIAQPDPTGSINLGGPLTTGTGLVFVGATLDGYLRAFTTADGKEVWKGKLPASARSTPALITTPDGTQMIVIAAGGHDPKFTPLDTKLVTFKLGPTR